MIVSFGKNVYSASASKKSEGINKPTNKKEHSNIRHTKNGNPYYKTNTGKTTGAIVGTIAGAVFPVTALVSKKPQMALMTLPQALITLAGCVVAGSIFDGVLNHNERKKADQIKKLNVNA